MGRYLRVLRHRDFALLWLGATISALGDGMSFVALVWLVIERTDDPGAVGVLAATYTAPVLLGGLAAGLILDRWDRRRVLVADNVLRGLLMASIPVAAAASALTTTHLFTVAAVYGLLFMTSLAGIPSLIPSLVDSDDLVTANALESISYGIAGLGGPVVAGVVIAAIGAPVVLLLDAASYWLFALCLLAMRPAPVPTAAPTPAEGPAAERDGGLRAAGRFVLRTQAILAITLLYMAVNVGEGMLTVLLPVYARDALGQGAAAYGLLAGSFAAGALAGSVLVGAVGWRWPLGRSIAAGVTLMGLVLSLLLPQPALPVAMGVLAASGLVASSLTPWAQTIRMRLIPAAMRGRVFALLRTLMQATPPIGALVAGVLLVEGSIAAVVLAILGVIAIPGLVALVHPSLGPVATGDPGAAPA